MKIWSGSEDLGAATTARDQCLVKVGIIFERRLVGRCLTALSAQTGYIERMKCILFGSIWKVWQHKKLALKKKKVEEGCVDLDPLT